MDFQTAIDRSGLNQALTTPNPELSPLGRPPITEAAADLAIAISKLEPISPQLIAFTHLCENSFGIIPAFPNTNGHPEAFLTWDKDKGKMVGWDIGPFQLNFWWTVRSIAAGEFTFTLLNWNDVWGSTFFDETGKPSGFTGLAVANGRAAARKLLSKRSTERFQAVAYTGPDHQAKRGGLYDLLIPYFENFFKLYSGGN